MSTLFLDYSNFKNKISFQIKPKDSSDSGELGLRIRRDSDILLKPRKESDFGNKNRKDSA